MNVDEVNVQLIDLGDELRLVFSCASDRRQS